MDVLGRARRLESAIAGRLDQVAKGLVSSRSRQPLEILLAILEAVEQRIEPTGRGARVFPFNRVEVSIVAPSLEARGRLEAVLGGDTPLQTRVLDRLRSAGCSPVDVVIEVRYVDTAEASWNVPEFDLQFARIARPETDRRDLDAQPAPIEIRAVVGEMERWAYSLAAPRIDIGRGAEVRDYRNRLIRVAFGPEVRSDYGDDESLVVDVAFVEVDEERRLFLGEWATEVTAVLPRLDGRTVR